MANEKRLIDAWKLVIDLAKIKRCGDYDHEDVMAVIASQETVDAVEVVRCKDCRGRNSEIVRPEGRCLCERISRWVFDDDFCSYGERKDNG